MKNTLTLSIAAVAALATSAFGADYSIFRICEDQHIIRTSDGAEAGRLEYIVVDPSNQRIISSIVTGGVIGEKFVAVPFSSMRFDADRSITLTEINRERIVSAPVIERTQISSATVIRPDIIDRTYQHFGVRANTAVDSTSVNTNVRQENRADRPSRDPNVAGRADQMRDDSSRDAGRSLSRDENSRRLSERARDASASAPERSRDEANTGAESRRNRAAQDRETQDQAGDNRRDSTDRSAPMNRGDNENKRSSSATEHRASGTGSDSGRARPATRGEQGGAAKENRQSTDGANRPPQSSSSERGSQPRNEEMPAAESNRGSTSPQSSSPQKESESSRTATPGGANSSSTPNQENPRGSR